MCRLLLSCRDVSCVSASKGRCRWVFKETPADGRTSVGEWWENDQGAFVCGKRNSVCFILQLFLQLNVESFSCDDQVGEGRGRGVGVIWTQRDFLY